MSRYILRTTEYVTCAVMPLAVIEYKYNRSHDELIANIIAEDSLNPFVSNKKDIEEIRKSTQMIKHWQSSGPRKQLFTAVPKRWKKD